MRFLALVLWLAIAGCTGSPAALRQVTIESPDALQLTLSELPASALHGMGLSYGLTVVKAGALARRAGLRVGDVVYAVNDKRIHGVDDFMRLLAEQPRTLDFRVRRGEADFYVPMELGPPSVARPASPSRDRLLRI